jgi:hypothetical protein
MRPRPVFMNPRQISDRQFFSQAQFPQPVSEYAQYAGCAQAAAPFSCMAKHLAVVRRNSTRAEVATR